MHVLPPFANRPEESEIKYMIQKEYHRMETEEGLPKRQQQMEAGIHDLDAEKST